MAQRSLLSAMGLLALAAAPVSAFWRLPCQAPVIIERADPIINPGVASPHLHTIMGGNGFGFNMDYAQTQASTCSTCTVQKDLSNYWIPNLWFQAENGSFTSVPQVGGVLVYYLQRPGDGEKLTAFPEGFRMVAGDPMKRSYGNDFESAAINYACLNFNGPATPETNGFPNNKCSSGLRAQVFFPSCWDGKNLDSPDHKSHMSYPANNHAYGSCPPSHPVHFVSLFFEVTFSTDLFDDMWYGDKQPFVWSMGDPTGYGLHGDFVNGWDVDHLQKAINECTNNSGRVEDCPVFTMTSDDVAKGCKIPPSIDEQTSGTLDALPGCNPVQAGPERAVSKSTGCTVSDVIGKPQAYFTDLTQTKQWSYTGCGSDSIYNRKFTGASTSSDTMTVETCVDFCSGKGFSVAGLEFGRECYCANSIPADSAPVPGYMGNCMTPCAGDAGEYCGGGGTISLYQKCTGSCQNAQFGVVGNSTAPAAPTRASVPSGSASIAADVVASSSATLVEPTATAAGSSATASTTASASLSSVDTNGYYASEVNSTPEPLNPSVSSTPSSSGTTLDTNGSYGSASSEEAMSTTAPSSGTTVDADGDYGSGSSTEAMTTAAPSSGTTVDTDSGYGSGSSASATSDVSATTGAPSTGNASDTTNESADSDVADDECEVETEPDGVIPIPTGTPSGMVSPTNATSAGPQVTEIPIPSSVPKTNVSLPEDWQAAGCYVDPVRPRLFKYWASFSGKKMSSSKCVKYCDKKGFAFAGTENGGQCFCSNEMAQNAELKDDSECSSVCKGAAGEICGGRARLSVFTKSGTSSMKRHLHQHRRGGYAHLS